MAWGTIVLLCLGPALLISIVKNNDGITVWGIFTWKTLGPFTPAEHHLNHMSTDTDRVRPRPFL